MVTTFDVTEQIGARRKAKRLALELQQSGVAHRLRAEQALRVNEERFHKALRGSPVMVFTQDRDLRYTWMQLVRQIEREVLGKTDGEVLEDPEAAKIIDRTKRDVLASGVGQRREIAVRAGSLRSTSTSRSSR